MAEVNRETMERIRRMETAMDAVQNALRCRGEAARKEPEIQGMLGLLEEYMDSGQWLADYELDEAGGFLPDLKRGVLAQDTLYDLLCTPQSE